MKELKEIVPLHVQVKDSKLDMIKTKCRQLNKLGKEYMLSCVNGSYELKSKWYNEVYRSNRLNLSPKELGFIKRVKNHVMKNEIYLNFEDQKFSDDITYMESNVTLKGKRMDSVVEIDINHAYWKTAHMLGVISDELYQEGADDSKGIGKIARLVALGALAKKKTYYQIVGGKMVKQTVERSELTENIWFTICFNVSRVMQETAVSLDKDYLFYWVDGIYVKNDPEAVDLAVSIFNSNGYSVKKKEIHKIDFDEDHFTVYNSKEDYDMPLGEDGKSKAGVRKFHYVDKNVYNLTKKYVVTARLNEYINSVIKKNRQSK